MREKTPSADDAPKRAPPASPREADVAANKTHSNFYEPFQALAAINSRMVVSTHNLDEMSHRNSGDQQQQKQQQQQQQKQQPPQQNQHQPQPQGHNFKPSLTAQDKRSRLSNVINNLRKKVPEPKIMPANDTRNSVERNLETLEQFVMTVLNDVIKEEEHKKEPKKQTPKDEKQSPEKSDENFEASQPNDVGMLEAAVPEKPEEVENKVKDAEIEDDAKIDEDGVTRTMGTLIMDRLTENQGEQESKVICRDIVNEVVQRLKLPEKKKLSIHCSLPLAKVASVLQGCVKDKSVKCVAKSSSIRHLCLYCDRKFLSISLRQRHIERVHHQSGGRRSERNLRKPFQSCQYCSEKCSESLEELFQHMVNTHGEKYHGCLLCYERYPNKDALVGHNVDIHRGVNSNKSQVKAVKEDSHQDSNNANLEGGLCSKISQNVRENLLYHLDGKLVQKKGPETNETSCLELTNHGIGTNPTPSDEISTSAATLLDSIESPRSDDLEDSRKSEKSSKNPRRVSFEKYNFPKKYDGKEQWNDFSIENLCSFDISTQIAVMKKRDAMKENKVESFQETEKGDDERTIFSEEFSQFLGLQRQEQKLNKKNEESFEDVHFTGEWSRPRVYVCAACTAKFMTLMEIEEHKVSSHPNSWCTHYDFAGDQIDQYKHLFPFVPVKPSPPEIESAALVEHVCTKCNKNCSNVTELYSHILECAGDQVWLSSITGSVKKKSKWRPFGSRSRRRKHRDMKKNMHHLQTPKIVVPKEKPPSGPRIRPSDRESIQKMLANLPPKRATRKDLKQNASRSQRRLRSVRAKTLPRLATENSSAKQIVRNKAVIKNKLLKNAKSIQRKRQQSDNLSAVIESVVKNINGDQTETIEPPSSSVLSKDDEPNVEKISVRLRRESKFLAATKISASKNKINNKMRALADRKKISNTESAAKPVEISGALKKKQKMPTLVLRSKGKMNCHKLKPVNNQPSKFSLKAQKQPRRHDGKFVKVTPSTSVNNNSQNSSNVSSPREARKKKELSQNDSRTTPRRTPRLSVDQTEKMPILQSFDENDELVKNPGETIVDSLPSTSTAETCHVSPRNSKKTDSSKDKIKVEPKGAKKKRVTPKKTEPPKVKKSLPKRASKKIRSLRADLRNSLKKGRLRKCLRSWVEKVETVVPEEECKLGEELEKVEKKKRSRSSKEEAPVLEKEDVVSDVVTPVNASLENLQQESSNSNLDSGKENSLVILNSPKSKSVRLKKARSQRRGSKRSLNNVIGILTEGVNIPVEAQESVVYTVQTSVGNNPRVENDDGVNNEPPVLEVQETLENVPENKAEEKTEPESNSANDIILDLSRRKTHGKGSFLEKIVSKIAKQKDVCLTEEVPDMFVNNKVEEETIESQRQSTKRPLDVDSSKMNKKKTVEEETVEEAQDEIKLSDIMSLIDQSQDEKIEPGKRKSLDEENVTNSKVKKKIKVVTKEDVSDSTLEKPGEQTAEENTKPSESKTAEDEQVSKKNSSQKKPRKGNPRKSDDEISGPVLENPSLDTELCSESSSAVPEVSGYERKSKKRKSKKKPDRATTPDDLSVEDEKDSEKQEKKATKLKATVSEIDDSLGKETKKAREPKKTKNKSEEEEVVQDSDKVDEQKKDADEKTEQKEKSDDKSDTKTDAKEEKSEKSSKDAPVALKRQQQNFALVHTKTGEILIVEKKKKFTKEAAKFFCEICSTSFTRKSSLNKHNLSQSHLFQLAKHEEELKKTVDENKVNENTISEVKQEVNIKEEQMEEVIFEGDTIIVREVIENGLEDSTLPSDDLTNTGPKPSEQTLEDKLLDEEICKITENMSHEEYVLTNHVSPVVPESSSTLVEKSKKKLDSVDPSKDFVVPVDDADNSKIVLDEPISSHLSSNFLSEDASSNAKIFEFSETDNDEIGKSYKSSAKKNVPKNSAECQNTETIEFENSSLLDIFNIIQTQAIEISSKLSDDILENGNVSKTGKKSAKKTRVSKTELGNLGIAETCVMSDEKTEIRGRKSLRKSRTLKIKFHNSPCIDDSNILENHDEDEILEDEVIELAEKSGKPYKKSKVSKNLDANIVQNVSEDQKVDNSIFEDLEMEQSEELSRRSKKKNKVLNSELESLPILDDSGNFENSSEDKLVEISKPPKKKRTRRKKSMEGKTGMENSTLNEQILDPQEGKAKNDVMELESDFPITENLTISENPINEIEQPVNESMESKTELENGKFDESSKILDEKDGTTELENCHSEYPKFDYEKITEQIEDGEKQSKKSAEKSRRSKSKSKNLADSCSDSENLESSRKYERRSKKSVKSKKEAKTNIQNSPIADDLKSSVEDGNVDEKDEETEKLVNKSSRKNKASKTELDDEISESMKKNMIPGTEIENVCTDDNFGILVSPEINAKPKKSARKSKAIRTKLSNSFLSDMSVVENGDKESKCNEPLKENTSTELENLCTAQNFNVFEKAKVEDDTLVQSEKNGISNIENPREDPELFDAKVEKLDKKSGKKSRVSKTELQNLSILSSFGIVESISENADYASKVLEPPNEDYSKTEKQNEASESYVATNDLASFENHTNDSKLVVPTLKSLKTEEKKAKKLAKKSGKKNKVAKTKLGKLSAVNDIEDAENAKKDSNPDDEIMKQPLQKENPSEEIGVSKSELLEPINDILEPLEKEDTKSEEPDKDVDLKGEFSESEKNVKTRKPSKKSGKKSRVSNMELEKLSISADIKTFEEDNQDSEFGNEMTFEKQNEKSEKKSSKKKRASKSELDDSDISVNEITERTSKKRTKRSRISKTELKSLSIIDDFKTLENSNKDLILEHSETSEKSDEIQEPENDEKTKKSLEPDSENLNVSEFDSSIPEPEKVTKKSGKKAKISKTELESLSITENIIFDHSRPKRRQCKQNYSEIDFEDFAFELDTSSTKRSTRSKAVKENEPTKITEQNLLEPENKVDAFESVKNITETTSGDIEKVENPSESYFTEASVLEKPSLEGNLNDAAVAEFNSDENSMDTNMSVDIQKIIDDPELSMESLEKEAEPIIETEEIGSKKLEKDGKKRKGLGSKKTKKLKKNNKNKFGRVESPDKRKIVKSVFGRVFLGEKSDEDGEKVVKDVVENLPKKKKGKETKGEGQKKNGKSKNEERSFKNLKEFSELTSRCRQSKKRAEERISRSFIEEDIMTSDAVSQKKKEMEETAEDSEVGIKGQPSSAQLEKEMEKIRDGTTPETSSKPEVFQLLPSLSPRLESTFYNLSRHSDSESSSDDDGDERVGLSPIFAYNTLDSSFGESSMSTRNELEKDEAEDNETKITSNLPSNLETGSEIVTITPTDAIEDNALDVPHQEAMNANNSRQALNFDEELFVECCSRLKATSENELRGAKKIKLDNSMIFRSTKNRWKDVESQNSLGSLLESVNQLLGEEMYNNEQKEQTGRSERSSCSASPRMSIIDNVGYEDSLDVAFEHNNKLRDKIQQRMRESEHMLSFGQKSCESEEKDVEHSMFDHQKQTANGFMDKALSNILQNNKRDHNGSNPMKVLAELACARAPTEMKTSPSKLAKNPIVKEPTFTISNSSSVVIDSPHKKSKSPSKLAAKKCLPFKKSKKLKRVDHKFPLIRNSQHQIGLIPQNSDKIRDVYDFDDDESQMNPLPPSSVTFYRNRTEEKSGALDSGKVEVSSSIEKSVPKTKGALKCFHPDERVDKNGPVDDCVERKKHKRSSEQQNKHAKPKKKVKSGKKKHQRNAWYENDSSDEFISSAKTEDVIGVGISKSQRTCSKGKQNLFAELSSTSSESELEKMYENDDETAEMAEKDENLEKENGYKSEKEDSKNDEQLNDDWMRKKSESDMSDRPLVIDEKKEADDGKFSDDDYVRAYEMDDLYRDDTSAESEYEKDEEKECGFDGEQSRALDENYHSPTKEVLDFPDLMENAVESKITRDTTSPEQQFENNDKVTESEDEFEQFPEKLTSNEKPGDKSDNLPLHVFLSRKVQESKKRKQQRRQQLLLKKKMQEKEKRMLVDVASSRRQRKCAIGKQGLLAEISSSDEELSDTGHKDKKHKRESKETKKERYLEKQREKRFANEQKAIEEMILRDVKKKKEQTEKEQSSNEMEEDVDAHLKKVVKIKEDSSKKSKSNLNNGKGEESKAKTPESKKKSVGNTKRCKPQSTSSPKEKERRSSAGGKRENAEMGDDDELRMTKSWNNLEEGVGVAIGRRKRAAANQLYYWSSSSDEEEPPGALASPEDEEDEEDERQEQHGWIVGDSHKRMITMLALEKQMKQKRRRSEDELDSGKVKGKKHLNLSS